jgi:hypothetical protein
MSDTINVANKSVTDFQHIERVPSNDEIVEQVGNFETDQDALPPGYFTSRFFVGSMLAIGLGLFSGTAGFKFAGPVLTVINAELGPVSDAQSLRSKSHWTNNLPIGSKLHLDITGIHIG